MRLNITESEMYYTNELDAIQDTIKKNFPNFDVHIARGKYPFVSVKVTKNANKNIHHRLSDLFTIRQEDDGRITCTCPTYDDAEFFDLIGIVNYFDDYLNNPNTENNRGYFESVKRNRKMTEEIVDTGDNEDIVDDLYVDLTDMVETMLVQLQNEINDIKYDVEHARNIDGEKAYYGIRNAKQSLDNVSTYLSYVRGAVIL